MHARNPSLRHLINLAAQRKVQSGATLITTTSATDDSAAKNTSWDLLAAGLSHLCDGGINGAYGLLTTAVSRASLRSAPIASALGITPPVYELAVAVTPCHEAHAQAVFLSRRMTEAVMHDIDTSAPVIERALEADKMIDRSTRHYFAQLAQTHRRQCETLLIMIDRLPPPPQPARGTTPAP